MKLLAIFSLFRLFKKNIFPNIASGKKLIIEFVDPSVIRGEDLVRRNVRHEVFSTVLYDFSFSMTKLNVFDTTSKALVRFARICI